MLQSGCTHGETHECPCPAHSPSVTAQLLSFPHGANVQIQAYACELQCACAPPCTITQIQGRYSQSDAPSPA